LLEDLRGTNFSYATVLPCPQSRFRSPQRTWLASSRPSSLQLVLHKTRLNSEAHLEIHPKKQEKCPKTSFP
jgi:hypothetical protein